MALVLREADRLTRDIDGWGDIPYRAIADALFHTPEQRLVPFLGAGASLEPGKIEPPRAPGPDVAKLERVCQELGIEGAAKVFLEVAACIAFRLQQRLKDPGTTTEQDLVGRLTASLYPPSAGDLAEAFCKLATYDSFARSARKVGELQSGRWSRDDLGIALRAVAAETGLCGPSAPLLSAASYLEYVEARTALWEHLRTIFANKAQPTETHRLVARAADHFLQTDPDGDYLIVTTNYDGLTEIALDELKTPYYAVTVQRTGGQMEGKVLLRFSDAVQEYVGGTRQFERLKKAAEPPKVPKNFQLASPKPLVCVHKIHGCLFPLKGAVDSLIITDEDYVWYINRDASADGILPESVRVLLQEKGLLFLGYSFSDWNIRSHYKSIAEARVVSPRAGVQDYAVMREISPYEKGFFGKKNIHILETSLQRFAEGVTKARANSSSPGAGVGKP